MYIKDPNSKWWDGYNGQELVIIDEFSGVINVTHLLRWLDRYPCRVEVKGASKVLRATKFWITSNIDPRNWYAEITPEQKNALMRRMDITQFVFSWLPPEEEFEEWIGRLTE